MNESNEEERRLRRFLLNQLDEEERQRVEERFLLDPEYRERVLAAEEELIEDYAEGSLSGAEGQRVRTEILSTPGQQQKLRTALLIKKYVEAAAHSPPAEVKLERPKREAASRLRRPYVLVPLAAALLVALGFGAVKYVEFRRQNELIAREQARRAEIERELVQLNETSTPAAYSVALSPILVRDLRAAPVVSPPSGAPVVELRLRLVNSDYDSYRAVVQKLDGASPLTIPNLRAQSASGEQAVHLKVPARLLTAGDYRVGLSGLAGGAAEEVGEYNFHVTD
jgi:hypothetical protein